MKIGVRSTASAKRVSKNQQLNQQPNDFFLFNVSFNIQIVAKLKLLLSVGVFICTAFPILSNHLERFCQFCFASRDVNFVFKELPGHDIEND
jgi:hypothetical protein